MHNKFFKIKLLNDFLSETSRARQVLLTELIDQGSNDVIVTRRFRMLQNLSELETQIIQKIQDFETDDVNDFAFVDVVVQKIVNRSA